jgi:DNA-binding LytR/AlgR family response regulator
MLDAEKKRRILYRIAACDNDPEDLANLKSCLKEYFDSHPNIDVQVDSFLRGGELKSFVEKRELHDLYLLDVMMPEIDGIALGRLIREQSSDVPIIYITSSRDFAFDAYGVSAMRYITKPIHKKMLYEALDEVYIKYRFRPRHILPLKEGSEILLIAAEDIMYVENQLRNAIYTMFDGKKITCTRMLGTFEEAVAPLPENPDFIQPHKSFFVNMKYIKIFGSDSITMDDGKLVPVNQKRLPSVRKTYLAYLSAITG